jgi:hypothetical protein
LDAIRFKQIPQLRFLDELGDLDTLGLPLVKWIRRYVLEPLPRQNDRTETGSKGATT